jgi:hypothetical protein
MKKISKLLSRIISYLDNSYLDNTKLIKMIKLYKSLSCISLYLDNLYYNKKFSLIFNNITFIDKNKNSIIHYIFRYNRINLQSIILYNINRISFLYKKIDINELYCKNKDGKYPEELGIITKY